MAIPQAAAGVLLRGRSAPIRISVSVTPCIWPGSSLSPSGVVGDPFPPSSFPQALVKSAESARAAVSSRTPRLSVWLLIESLFPWFACRDCSPTEIWKRADWLGRGGMGRGRCSRALPPPRPPAASPPPRRDPPDPPPEGDTPSGLPLSRVGV